MTFIAQGTKYFNSLGAGRLNSKNYAKKIIIIRSYYKLTWQTRNNGKHKY